MKNVIFKLTIILSMFTGMASAHAGTDPRSSLPAVRLIEIRAEYYPNETFYLGYAENPDHSINSIYYENNEHEKRFYSFKDLRSDVAIIKTTSGNTVYDLVRLNIQPSSSKSVYNVSMSYMKNGLFKNRKSVEFRLEMNNHRQLYELIDAETDELIHRTYVQTNFWGSMAVGIDKIISTK